MLRYWSRTVLLTSLISLLLGCHDTKYTVSNQPIGTFKSEWFVMGTVANPGYAHGEVLALGLDGTSFRSAIDDRHRFGIELPDNATYAFYFFAPPGVPQTRTGIIDVIDTSGGGRSLKQPGALLSFDESADIGLRNSLRLPKVIDTRRLFLGEVDIKGNQAFPTRNPSTQLDFDGDGYADDVDNDDQNDGLLDAAQQLKQEQIEICHVTGDDLGKTHIVPLSLALPHLLHGDGVGACRKNRHARSSTQPQPAGIDAANLAPVQPTLPGPPPEITNNPQHPGHFPAMAMPPAPQNSGFPSAFTAPPTIERTDDDDEGRDEENEPQRPKPRPRKKPSQENMK